MHLPWQCPLTMVWLAQQDGVVLPDFILKVCIDTDALGISITSPQRGEWHGQGLQPTRSKWIGGTPSSSSASPPDFLGCWWGALQASRDQHLHSWAGSGNFSQVTWEKPEATKAARAGWQHPLPAQGLVRSSQPCRARSWGREEEGWAERKSSPRSVAGAAGTACEGSELGFSGWEMAELSPAEPSKAPFLAGSVVYCSCPRRSSLFVLSASWMAVWWGLCAGGIFTALRAVSGHGDFQASTP